MSNEAEDHVERKEGLKQVIRQLHEGKSVEEVKDQFADILEDVGATEVAEIEQELIEEGLPAAEIQRLCDVHVAVFRESLEEETSPESAPGHPVYTFLAENAAAQRILDELESALETLKAEPNAENLETAEELLSDLQEYDRHYLRQENVLFPYLEKHGFEGPSKVMWGIHDEIRDGIQDKLDELEESGAELVPIHLPHMKYGIATYYILATAEASSNLARYDGIRYGHRADIKEVEKDLKEERAELEQQIKEASGEEQQELVDKLEDMDSSLIRLYKKSRTEGFGTEVKRRIMLGTYVLSAGYYDAYYAKAQKVRRLIKQDFTEAFEDVDVIVSPTAPTTAFDLGSNIDNPVQMYLNDMYTTTANLAGICGISVPAGEDSNGLPYGMQLMADTFEEGKLFNAARLVEQLS